MAFYVGVLQWFIESFQSFEYSKCSEFNRTLRTPVGNETMKSFWNLCSCSNTTVPSQPVTHQRLLSSGIKCILKITLRCIHILLTVPSVCYMVFENYAYQQICRCFNRPSSRSWKLFQMMNKLKNCMILRSCWTKLSFSSR